MATCLTDLIKIRAKATVKIGDYEVTTPDILSISVSRSRGKPVSSASIHFRHKINEGTIDTDMPIEIKFFAFKIFTGTIKRMSVSPSLRVAREMVVRLQAEDDMYKLNNKRITRRQKNNGLGPVVFITSVYKRPYIGFDDPTRVHDVESYGSSPQALCQSVNICEMDFLCKDGVSSYGDNHYIQVCSSPLDFWGSTAGGGGMVLHDHTSLSITEPHGGGPAAAVFGVK